MASKYINNNPDLNSEDESFSTSPSQQKNLEPATTAGFSFIKAYGDTMGTRKFISYKPAKIHRGKKWFVWFQFRNPETGKFQRFKKYEDINYYKGRDREEYAEILLRAINFGLSKGYNPFQQSSPLAIVVKNWTLVQGLNYFKQNLHTRGLRNRTVQSYESVLRSMNEGLKELLLTDINQITKHQIGSFLRSAHIKNKWSNATFNNNLTFIRSIFNYLIEADILKENPAKVKPLPETITRHRYFEDDVFEKIKQKAEGGLLRFLMFLYHTGARPNEARQLSYDHILIDRKLLFIPAAISKNKKDDYVPLSDYILENFKGKGPIFGTSVNYYSGKFNKLKKELGLHKDYTLYSIKHTRAVHLAQDNVSPYAIMQLFRHSSLEITMKYLRDLGFTVNREAADMVRK